MRNVWKYYFSSTEGVIFVVDASDRDRISDVKEELWAILKEGGSGEKVPMLLYANKQDIDGALKFNELVEILDLHENSRTDPKALVHI